jgi:methylglutaconyl-CoA hydratase
MPPMTAVKARREGPLLLVELARPDSGNALERAVVEELTAAVGRAHDAGARALVLTGQGKHFCSGANLDELARLAEAPFEERLADALALAALYGALLRCPLFTAAAVHGAAYGGGLGLAAACDLVVAGPGSRLQFSEVRLGFVPALISVFLTRRLAPARLATVFLDPAPIDGAAALACGLVDEVAASPLERSRERALEVARKASPEAVAQTKRLLLTTTMPHLDEQLAHAARVNAEQRAHPECRRGVAHFLARKSFPDWLDPE